MAAKALIILGLCAALGTGVTLWRAAAQERRANADFPPLGQFVEVDGTPLHIEVTGSGPDLVLIHGAAGNLRDMTLALAPALARNYRVFSVDRPGLGHSPARRAQGDSITTQADLISRAVAQLGAEKPLVLGHSYGGAVALAWAVHHPERLSGVVPLAAASHPWTTPLDRLYRVTSHPLGSRFVVPALTAFVGEDRINAGLHAVFRPDPVPPGYLAHFGVPLTLRRASLRANAMQRASLLGEITALAPLYPQITAPMEILHGTADKIVDHDLHAAQLAARVPGAVLTSMPGVGHMPHHVDQDLIIAAIERVATRAGLR